jgi:hypothetical protein
VKEIFQEFVIASPDAVFICGPSTIFQINNPAIKMKNIIVNIH